MPNLEEQLNSFANYSESRNDLKREEDREDSIDRILREKGVKSRRC